MIMGPNGTETNIKRAGEGQHETARPDATQFYLEDEGSIYLYYVETITYSHTVRNPKS
jgi:hypothetical protein